MTQAVSRWATRLKGVVMGPYRVESAPLREGRHDPPRSNMLRGIDLSGLRVQRRVLEDVGILWGSC